MTTCERTVVYFGNDWFGENKTSSHHIAERLATTHKLLYVECPGLRMPKGSKRDIRKIFTKIMKSCASPRQEGEQFWIYTLFQIPLHKFSWVRKLNEKIILFALKRVMAKLKLSDPLLWFHIPHLSMIPGKLAARGVVYYCIDSYSSLPHVDKLAIQAMDDQLTRLADIVFVSSEPLYKRKATTARELVLSPHGVDFKHFNVASAAQQPLSNDIATFKKPVIGFWGLIENRVDLELIRYLAQSNPDWTIVMIGHVDVQENPCAGLKNVHFTGPKKYAELPDFARSFDVVILPYKQNEFVYHCNPIKLREYLATGKPAVSTRYPEIEKYQDVIAIADSYEDFADKITWYLEHDSAQLAALRTARVQAESWDSRVQEINRVVTNRFYCEANP